MKNHVINKVSLVLPASDYSQARKYQAAAKHWVSHTLVSLLNNHLEKISKEHEIVFIEKIEINLTDLPWDMPDTQWQQRLAASIRVNQFSPNTVALIVKQWFFYLNNGCFEKDSICKTSKEIEFYLLSHIGSLSSELLKRYSSDISMTVLQRLFNQHTEDLVIIVIEKLLDIPRKHVVQLYMVLLHQLKAQPYKSYAVFSKIVQANQSGDVNEKERWVEVLLRKEIPVQYIDDVTTKDNQLAEETKQSKRIQVTETFIECPHSGLVLLFPYLQRFFETCNLVEGKTFVNEVAQKSAIQALYFLATGESFGPEEHLVLPKLLCGQALDVYVEFEQVLPASIIAEGNQLLQSVIDNWKILQHSSIEGFRETFLQRKGKLIHKSGVYTLQVEESGVDILLNTIPWGFRNHKLPWMSSPLITEWY